MANISKIFFLGLVLARKLISLEKDFLVKPMLEAPSAFSARLSK
jgi:hypothetical protein